MPVPLGRGASARTRSTRHRAVGAAPAPVRSLRGARRGTEPAGRSQTAHRREQGTQPRGAANSAGSARGVWLQHGRWPTQHFRRVCRTLEPGCQAVKCCHKRLKVLVDGHPYTSAGTRSSRRRRARIPELRRSLGARVRHLVEGRTAPRDGAAGRRTGRCAAAGEPVRAVRHPAGRVRGLSAAEPLTPVGALSSCCGNGWCET